MKKPSPFCLKLGLIALSLLCFLFVIARTSGSNGIAPDDGNNIDDPIRPDAAGIIYVSPTGTGNGTSWDEATFDLHNAIHTNGVQKVFVAIGNYEVGAHSFIMKNGVAIYGGFDPENNIRTLNDSRILPNLGMGTGSVLNGENARPVIWNVFTSSTKMNSSAVLDGFTIMNGSYNADGAGIRNIYASPTLRNLVIKDNTASYGGGIANTSYSSPILINVSIVNNTATSFEGAAGMYNTASSSPVLTNVTIAYNKATASNAVAGGVRNSSAASTPAFYNCIIWDNTINGNTSASQADMGGSVAALKNSITQSYTTSNTADNNLVGTDPKFADVTNNDYTLSAASPAIDAGKNSWFIGLNATTKDLAGKARVYNFATGGTIDMGAYESPYEAVGALRPDAAGIIYVSPSGTGNGSSWDKATFDLHNAIHTNGVQKVFVAIGNYEVGAHSFIMKNGVAIYGGFDPDNNIRTLSDRRILPNLGMGAGSVLDGQNARPVVWNVFDSGTIMDNTAVLDGFTITNGKYDNNGAGIRNIYASPTLTNLVITGNDNTTSAYDRGGAGIYMYYSSPLITNVLITGNTSGAQGAGAWADQYSYPVLTNVQITKNKGYFQGGTGFYNDKTASSTLTNVSITDNTSSNGLTGGVYNLGTLRLTNVTLAGNTANNTSKAIYMGNSSNIQINNSIIYGTIEGTGTYTAQYTLIEGNVNTSNGNPDATGVMLTDIFTDPVSGDYTLEAASPAINAGSNTAYTSVNGDLANDLDLAGNPRVYDIANGGIIDMGTYEYQGDVNRAPVITSNGGGSTASISVSENTTAVTTVTATDADGDELTFNIAGGADAARFSINAQTGVLTFRTAPDYEDPSDANTDNSYAVTVQVSDGRGGTATQAISVTVADIDEIPPAIPSGLTAIAGDTRVVLNWTANMESDLASYKIYGGTTPNPTTVLATVSKRTITYTHTGLTNGTTYYYQITAVDAVGNESVASTEINAIPKAPQVITFGPLSAKTYGDVDFAPGATSTNSSIAITYSSSNESVATIVDGKIHIVGAGMTTITASQAGGTAYTAATDVPQTLTVNPKALTITANDRTKIYGETLNLGTAEFTPTGLVNGDVVNSVTLASPGAIATAAVTTYDITATAAQGPKLSNYDITYAKGTLTVNKKALTITANDRTKIYGETLNLGTTEFTPTGLVNGDAVTSVTLSSPGAIATADAGTYDITASAAQGPKLSNYDITYAKGTLTVGKKALTITANNRSKIYGETLTLGTAEFTPTGLVNGDVVNSVTLASAGAAATAAVTTYDITASAAQGPKLSNYDITYAKGTLTVNPKALTITANNRSKIYGETLNLGTAEFTPTGLVNGDEVTSVTLASTGAVATAAVTTYDITASAAQGPKLSNYDITYAKGTLTVNPKALTITANNRSKTYGETLNLGTAEFTPAGLVNGDAVTSVTLSSPGAIATADAGTYDITASAAQGPKLSNYDITYAKGTLTVNKKALTITAKNRSKTYGSELALGTTEFTTSGLVNGNTVTSVTLASAGAAATAVVDTYDIDATNAQGSGLSNYNITYTKGTLTVGKKALTITANNRTKVYGETLNLGTAEFTPARLVNGDAVTSVTLASPGATATADVDTYDITASAAQGPKLSNYDITYIKGTLTVNKAPQTISFVSPGTLSRDAGTVDLDVEASSGLSVSLAIDDEMIATVNSTALTMTVKRLGTVTLTATQEGNHNYLPAAPVSVTVRIANDAGAALPIRVHQAVSPNGDGINEFLQLEGIRDYPENKVTIFDKSGKVLAEIESYDNRDRMFPNNRTVRDGTYYYYLDIKVDGEWKREKGFFVVRR